jgi:hypothetical protein
VRKTLTETIKGGPKGHAPREIDPVIADYSFSKLRLPNGGFPMMKTKSEGALIYVPISDTASTRTDTGSVLEIEDPKTRRPR